MPSADSIRSHLEMQLEEWFQKACSLPACVCDLWNHLEAKRSFSSVTDDFQVSRSVSALKKRMFSALGRGDKDCFVCACGYREHSE